MSAVFVVFAVLLLFAWGAGRTHDSDVVFYSLLLAYCKLLQQLGNLDFSSHTTTKIDFLQQPFALVAVCTVCMFPLLRTSPFLAVATFASSLCLFGEENMHILAPFALVASMASDTVLRLCYSCAAIYMTGQELTPSVSLAVLFLLVHSVVVRTRMIKPMYVCALGVGLSLSCIVFVDLLTSSSSSEVSTERLLLVAAFQVNLFRRPSGQSITWTQVQQILGVFAGSLLAQHVIHPFHQEESNTLQDKCKVSLTVTLISLVFISKQTPGGQDLNVHALWYLRFFAASKPEITAATEEQVSYVVQSPLPPTTTPAIELSSATRSQPEIMELSSQYSGLLTLLARSEVENRSSATTGRNARDQCKRRISEGTTLMRMLVLCEDMLQLMQLRITALQSEVKVFTSSSHVQMAKQSAVNLKLVENDFALVERMMLTKLKPKCARKHEEAMTYLNKWSKEKQQMTREEQQDYDTMVEVVRKRMKPKKQQQRTLAQAEDSIGGMSSPEQRKVSVDVVDPKPEEELLPVAAPPMPAKPSRLSSFRRSASFSRRNDESMSSAGNASITSTQKRKLRLLGMLPTFGRSKKKKNGVSEGEEES